MITGKQMRAARGLLKWTVEDLAKKAGLTREGVTKIEEDAVQPRASSMTKILHAFENQGIEFIGTRGVSMKDEAVVTLRGENVFFRVLDDVIATLRHAKDPEALFACVEDRLSPPVVVENYRRLRKSGIKMRSLVREDDTYLMGKLEEYRCLPKDFFHNNATVIYGNKFATMILDPETGEDVSAVIVQNPHVASAQRNLFNLVWTNASQPTTTIAETFYDE